MDERKPRSRRLLVTTKTLENAIAAPASIGLSRPAAASGRAAVAEHGHVAGAELHQGAEGRTRLALGAVLEPAPGEDEAGDARGCLEVDVAGAVGVVDRDPERVGHPGFAGGAEEERPERPPDGRQDADGHEGVHGGGAVAQVGPGGPVERPGAPHTTTGAARVSEAHCQ
jgi:hypothetical protein